MGSALFSSQKTQGAGAKICGQINCGALTTVREAKWNFLLSFATLPPSFPPVPIPLWADRHIWSSCNRISWWLVTLATISQKLHVLCFSIVPLAAASLEWILRPNLHAIQTPFSAALPLCLFKHSRGFTLLQPSCHGEREEFALFSCYSLFYVWRR